MSIRKVDQSFWKGKWTRKHKDIVADKFYEIPHRWERRMKLVGPHGEVECEISHRLEKRTKHSLQGCGNLSLAEAF